jgi:hypothetical protein
MEYMSLILRSEKGSRLTISEMDGNLVHLNNNPLLLGKIKADLNLPIDNSKIILITNCMGPILFTEGETVTFKSGFENKVYGTASIVNVSEYSGVCKLNSGRYSLELENLSFRLSDLLPELTIEGDSSGASTGVVSLGLVNTATPQPINLNVYGSSFKINEILLTGINGTYAQPTNCYITDENGIEISSIGLGRGGDLLVSVNLFEGEWVQMSLNTEYNKVITNNTIYFSADTAAGSTCTVDVYVFGYTLQ